jgi:arylsulfatase B
LNGAEDYFFHNISLGNVSAGGCAGLDFVSASEHGRQAATGYQGSYSAGVFGAHAAALVRDTPRSTPLFIYAAWQSVHSPVEVPRSTLPPCPHTAPPAPHPSPPLHRRPPS